MPTNYAGRVAITIIVLLIALVGIPWIGGGIFPIAKLTDSSIPWNKKIDLKPGIDIAGGTKLLYEIKAPPGANLSGNNLAEEVEKILKIRIDPDGVKNYVWRPQGNTRLEIQIPHEEGSEKNDAIRTDFSNARNTLNSLNLRKSTVQSTVEKLSGDQQKATLDQLAKGDPRRQALFAKLVDLYHTKTTSTDPQHQAQAEIDYDAALGQIEADNIYPDALDDILKMTGSDRDQALKPIKEKAASFPAYADALNHYIAATDAVATLKNSTDDATEVKRKLQGSGVLEFHILVPQQDPQMASMAQRLHERGPTPRSTDTTRWYVMDNKDENFAGMQEYNKKRYVLAYTEPFCKPGGTSTPPLALVHSPSIAPWGLMDARSRPDSYGSSMVEFEFDDQGAAYFEDLTKNNINRPMGIVLDDKMISAPTIRDKIGKIGTISSGNSGGFTATELDYMISTLKAGSLPAQLGDTPISEVSVGPTVGADNLHRGLVASLIGLVVVAVFLCGYYFIPGIVATVAVGMNLLIILGVLAMFGSTFTLPGIAGIALTVGMAVDANVLIFERFREEKHRGLSTRMSLRNAYDRAFTAIIDSNVTTAITSIVLYAIGSEEVKGFGLTLLIGILSSLFTALFVTKTIFGIMIDKFDFDNFSSIPTVFPKWDKLLHPKIDWMSKAWIFVTCSVIMLVAGLFCFWQEGRSMYDIEFASGSSVDFLLKDKPANGDSDVQEWLDTQKQELPSMNLVRVGDSGKQYEVVTPNLDVNRVRDAILTALSGKLQLEEPSHFQDWDQMPSDAFKAGLIVPIKNAQLQVDGLDVPKAAEYDGGAAIILRDLSPKLSVEAIDARLNAARRQEGYTHPNWSVWVARVDGSSDRNEPVDRAVVLVADPNTQYDDQVEASKDAWRDKLAEPIWKDLIVPGIHSDVKLQQVTKFDKQVAGDAQRDAWVATFASVVIIMLYIWVRFGNLKYGTATVVAMLHDTLLTIGFIGISHYIAFNPIGRFLLVDAFRVNLTLVAAVLTIMSYSMIDTVVVFDRIRENRGRFGYISKQVINDSINQTLSRTLLTCSTTIFTVATMYIFGGPGIHGFTFVLLVGILVGTYSSIAIAAPLLLIGATQTTDVGRKPPIGAVQRAGA